VTSLVYQGSELQLFAAAEQWNRYLAIVLRPYIGGSVLEVGAGLGTTTRALHHAGVRQWLCLEPDRTMYATLVEAAERSALPSGCAPMLGTIADLAPGDVYDTVLYVDVLEHIRDDADELALAGSRLSPAGYLVVLAPAHQSLYAPFDAAIGHFRRYDRAGMHAIAPPGLALVAERYLDAAGMLLSLGNRMLLRRSKPSALQIAFWDRFVVPISRLVDPLLAFRVGRSVLAVWQRPR